MSSIDRNPKLNQGASLESLLASFSTSLTICGFVVVLSVFVKPKLSRIYSRIYLDTALKCQTKAVWPRMIFLPMPDLDATCRSTDNYFLDRYIHTLCKLFLTLTLVLLPVLLPLNACRGKNEAGGVRGLDKLSFSNVGLAYSERYWAHLLLSIFVAAFLGLNIRFELDTCQRLRQTLTLGNPWDSSTLMITTSRGQINVDAIRYHFRHIAGQIQSIELNRDYGGLYDAIKRRDTLLLRLEDAEIKLIKKANASKTTKRRIHEQDQLGWRRFLRPEERPQMRLPVMLWNRPIIIPFIGVKVDAINHYRSEIVRHNLVISRQRRAPHPHRSAFVTFHAQHSGPLNCAIGHKKTPRSWSISRPPAFEDITWANLRLGPRERALRGVVAQILITALIFGISLPVSLSQITYLANAVSSLAGVRMLPTKFIALLQGVILPALVVSFVSFIVPRSLRILARLASTD